MNPPKGYFSQANNKFLPNSEKYHLSWNCNPTARARRIDNLIQEKMRKKEKFSVEDSMGFQLDTYDQYAEYLTPALVRIMRRAVERKLYPEKNSELVLEGANILGEWDYLMSEESIGGAVAQVFEWFYVGKFGGAEQEELIYEWKHANYLFDTFHVKNVVELSEELERDDGQGRLLSARWCGSREAYPCVYNIVDAMEDTMRFFHRRGKRSNWRWKYLHEQFLGHTPMKQTPLSVFFSRSVKYGGSRR